MSKYWAVILCCISIITKSYSQKFEDDRKLLPYKVGIIFNTGNEKSFISDDPDYYYHSTSIKSLFFYHLKTYKKFKIDLLIQPQIHTIEHQLYNEQFVTPDIPDFEEKRERFTKRKKITLSALEVGLDIKKEFFKKTTLFLRLGIGLGYIDIETERLAHGFTFIENATIGVIHKINQQWWLEISTGVGHVSNLNIKQPNSGYNTYDIGIGLHYHLK